MQFSYWETFYFVSSVCHPQFHDHLHFPRSHRIYRPRLGDDQPCIANQTFRIHPKSHKTPFLLRYSILSTALVFAKNKPIPLLFRGISQRFASVVWADFWEKVYHPGRRHRLYQYAGDRLWQFSQKMVAKSHCLFFQKLLTDPACC